MNAQYTRDGITQQISTPAQMERAIDGAVSVECLPGGNWDSFRVTYLDGIRVEIRAHYRSIWYSQLRELMLKLQRKNGAHATH